MYKRLVQYGLSTADAEAVYRDVRFYAFGIALGAYAGTVALAPGEADALLRRAIERFAAPHARKKEAFQ